MTRELALKLFVAVTLGIIVIVYSLFGLGAEPERHLLVTEAVKDVGVVIIGIAVAEVVWALVGGAPTELAVKGVAQGITEMSQQIRSDVKGMSVLTADGNRVGLADVGTSLDELSWSPTHFIGLVARAMHAIDLCGATLYYIYSNDGILNALVGAADRGIQVRVLLPSADSQFIVATFKDEFRDLVCRTATQLSEKIKGKNSNIQLKHLKDKTLTMSLLRVDDEMLVVPYLYEFQTTESPRFCVRGVESPLFKLYEREFSALFDRAEAA
jgi:hypothetical protein